MPFSLAVVVLLTAGPLAEQLQQQCAAVAAATAAATATAAAARGFVGLH